MEPGRGLCVYTTASGEVYEYSIRLGGFSRLVSDLTNVAQVSCGYGYYLCLSSDGHVHVIGDNEFIQLANGDKPTLVPELDGTTQISAGDCHVLALRSDY